MLMLGLFSLPFAQVEADEPANVIEFSENSTSQPANTGSNSNAAPTTIQESVTQATSGGLKEGGPKQVGAQADNGQATGGFTVPYDGPIFRGKGLYGGAAIVEEHLDDGVSKEGDIKELIIGWTNFLLSIAALLAVVAIVWAGFLYITAAGDDSRMETAKKIVIWVIVGILLILAAYAIVNTVMQAVF